LTWRYRGRGADRTRGAKRAWHAREVPSRAPLETLVDYLQARTLLLVVDNCEHLVAGCAALVEAFCALAPGCK